MNLLKRAAPLSLALALMLVLPACGPAGPEMPMELRTGAGGIVLGRTSMSELAELGWTAKLTGAQREIRQRAKFVAFHYRLERDGGTGGQFQVSVYVPFEGRASGGAADISRERSIAGSQGVAYRVSVGGDAARAPDVSYNGKTLRDIRPADAGNWGAVREEGVSPAAYTLEAARGTLRFVFDEDGGLAEFTLTMSAAAFERLRA